MDPDIQAKQNQITTMVNNAITNGAFPPNRHEEITRRRDEAEQLVKEYKQKNEDETARLKSRLDDIIKNIDSSVDRILRG